MEPFLAGLISLTSEQWKRGEVKHFFYDHQIRLFIREIVLSDLGTYWSYVKGFGRRFTDWLLLLDDLEVNNSPVGTPPEIDDALLFEFGPRIDLGSRPSDSRHPRPIPGQKYNRFVVDLINELHRLRTDAEPGVLQRDAETEESARRVLQRYVLEDMYTYYPYVAGFEDSFIDWFFE